MLVHPYAPYDVLDALRRGKEALDIGINNLVHLLYIIRVLVS